MERVISALKVMGKPKLADAVAEVSQRESLYEPCEEDSLRWEAICKSLNQKLQHHSEDLEMEWEKGEKEWREYLKEWKKVEEDWAGRCCQRPTNTGELYHCI